MNSLSEGPKYLDISKVSKGFAITITKEVIKYLEIDQTKSKEIAFCTLADTDKIFLISGTMKGGEIFLAASKLSRQNTLIIPEPVRRILQINIGDIIQYWRGPDARISIKKTEMQF